ncbi:MAG TPA: CPBP family intramembrane glutamic endopeptidase, partial [Terriglobales bacterium]|nr:CPBP family intramembrane glutamic endopeptidase [Terriglobales bacterium]
MSDVFETMSVPPMPRYGILKGPNSLRAGWRLLIFVAILVPLSYGVSRSVDALLRPMHADHSTPLDEILSLDWLVLPLLIATWIMGRIERRTLADYGLPWRRAFGRQFWQGAGFSFASFTVLLLVMRLAGVFSFGVFALHGFDVWKYAAAWGVLGFLGALLEDFFYRGYLLFTLTTGIRFWPAAVVTSLLMGGTHYFNPGGHGLGPVSATMYCLVTVLVLRRTGDLWMPLGIHSAWAWGEIYFYGVPDSGYRANGHLLNATFHGHPLLTGGGFGPEASIFTLLMLAIWGVIFSFWLRE